MSKKKPKKELKIEFQNLKNNPVAKFAHRVNRAEFFRDHTVYSRKGKHKNNEPFHIDFSVQKNQYEKTCVVFCIKHDEDTIRASDYVIDIGSGARIDGGHVTAKGTPEEIMQNPNSLTGRYLNGELTITVPEKRREAVDF